VEVVGAVEVALGVELESGMDVGVVNSVKVLVGVEETVTMLVVRSVEEGVKLGVSVESGVEEGVVMGVLEGMVGEGVVMGVEEIMVGVIDSVVDSDVIGEVGIVDDARDAAESVGTVDAEANVGDVTVASRRSDRVQSGLVESGRGLPVVFDILSSLSLKREYIPKRPCK
jgi:hypothetical protein